MAEENQFYTWAIIFLCTALFLVSLYSFGIGLEEYYPDANMTINDDRIDLSGLETQLTASNNNTNNWAESYVAEDISLFGQTILFLKTIWGIVTDMFSMIITTAQILTKAGYEILGIPQLVTSLILGILLILLIFSSFKLLYTGGGG